MPVTIKEAARIAVDAVQDLFDDQVISNVRFEEVDKNSTGDWLITVGFDRKVDKKSTVLGGALGQFMPTERKYKVARIDSAGDVQSVKDRLL